MGGPVVLSRHYWAWWKLERRKREPVGVSRSALLTVLQKSRLTAPLRLRPCRHEEERRRVAARLRPGVGLAIHAALLAAPQLGLQAHVGTLWLNAALAAGNCQAGWAMQACLKEPAG